MKRLSALAAIALLAACSGEEPAPEPSASQPAAQASATPSATLAATQATLAEVPAAFLGYWDHVDGQCAIWSEAQLSIEPRRLTFYESTGDVTAVRQPDPDTIIVSMAMSGEGDTWTEESTYRLVDGGKVLESSFDHGDPFRRKRCTALVDVPMK